MVDDGFCLVSKSLSDDEKLHNMTGDTTTPEDRQGGREKQRRQAFEESKTTSTQLWKWKQTTLSDPASFSDFHVVSTEFDSEILNRKRVIV